MDIKVAPIADMVFQKAIYAVFLAHAKTNSLEVYGIVYQIFKETSSTIKRSSLTKEARSEEFIIQARSMGKAYAFQNKESQFENFKNSDISKLFCILNRLQSNLREILLLRYAANLTPSEISIITKQPIDSIEAILQIAINEFYKISKLKLETTDIDLNTIFLQITFLDEKIKTYLVNKKNNFQENILPVTSDLCLCLLPEASLFQQLKSKIKDYALTLKQNPGYLLSDLFDEVSSFLIVFKRLPPILRENWVEFLKRPTEYISALMYIDPKEQTRLQVLIKKLPIAFTITMGVFFIMHLLPIIFYNSSEKENIFKKQPETAIQIIQTQKQWYIPNRIKEEEKEDTPESATVGSNIVVHNAGPYQNTLPKTKDLLADQKSPLLSGGFNSSSQSVAVSSATGRELKADSGNGPGGDLGTTPGNGPGGDLGTTPGNSPGGNLGTTPGNGPGEKVQPATISSQNFIKKNQPIIILSKKKPQYTDLARAEQIEGKVVLLVEFQSSGIIGEVRVIQSLGYGLDENAVRSIRMCRFEPAFKDGNPISVTTKVVVTFSLKSEN